MASRTIRITRRVNVQIRRRITYRQEVTYRPVALPSPPQASVGSSRLLTTRSSPVREIRQNAIDYAEEAGLADEVEHDLFILHASEDQADVVEPLAGLLTAAGVSVWYSAFVMKPGMSLRQSIDAGIAKCEWGVVVLSPHFFDKPWPNYELNGLVARAMHENKQMILPIWHNVSHADVLKYSPSLADLFALTTARGSIGDIARQIVDAVKGDQAA